MGSIYKSVSQESLRQDIYLTPGVNETYDEFTCRVSGLQIKFARIDSFLRRMSSGSSNSSQDNFKGHFDYASTLDEYHSPPGDWSSAAQSYYFHMRAGTLKQASSRIYECAEQDLIEQPHLQSRYRETNDEKRTVLQRILSYLTWCCMPCIKLKK